MAVLAARQVLFHIMFWGFHWGLFAIGMYKQLTDKRLSGVNVLKHSIWISRGAGLVLSVDALMILLPMCRTILRWVRPKFRILPLDESTWFHRQVAYAMLLFTVVHTSAHYVNFFNIEKTQIRPVTAVQIHYTQPGGITGHIMLLCMLLMYTTAHHKIRQQSFESFWYTHHLFVPFFLALYTHSTGCFVRNTADPISPFGGAVFWKHCLGYHGWRWELWGGGLYLLQRLYRELRSQRETEIVKVIRHPYDVVEIQFRKPSMKYKAGQWLFLNVPGVSYYQWHPFTITSCPFDENISVHVRQVGDFTRALAGAVGAGHEQFTQSNELDPMAIYEIALQQGQHMPKLRIDGPYGAPAEDVFENETSVIIGTGIGVTPWASILKNIWHLRSKSKSMRLRRVDFIWVCRDTSSFEWFQALLASLEAQSGSLELRIHTYLTQSVDADTASNIMLNSAGADQDPLTKLKAQTNFGRPDFTRLLCSMREEILNDTYMERFERSPEKTNVGVYFCGPAVAAREIRAACITATSQEVNFKFWKEHF